MSDSEPHSSLRAAKRTVSGLTASQIQHKRDIDRKAQRALRQRTKTRIQELENDIARYKNSSTQREQTMIEEIQLLRDQNRQLRSSLERIGRFALGEIPGLDRTSLPHDTFVAQSAHREVEPIANEITHHGGGASRAHFIPAEASPGSYYGMYSAGNETIDPHFPNATRSLESDRRTLPPIAGAFAGLITPSDTQPHRSSNSESLSPFNNVHTTEDPVSPTGGPRSVAWILPKHTTATCPLDQILLDFIASRRSMLARGIPSAEVLGPEQLCPRDLLDPAAVSNSHAISRVMAEVLATFTHVKQPEKWAFMYIMHRTTRWQISPSSASYARMPVWLRPTVMQITIPHAAWIDNIPWPRVRDILIEEPDRYPFAVFSELYSEHVSINWPYDSDDIVVDTDDGPSLNTIFEKHIQRLSNWVAPRQFREYFSEWTPDVYVNE